MSEFGGSHVFVTGASTGIGLATSRHARAQGRAGVHGGAQRRQAQRGGRCDYRRGRGGGLCLGGCFGALWRCWRRSQRRSDASDPSHALFANAGSGGKFAPLGDYSDDTFDAVLRTNLTSAFWSIKHVLPGMIDRKRGSVLVTGSLASERGMPNNVGYVVSKHGLLGLARAAAVEAAPHNVRVNCLIPGLIETPMLMQLDPHASPEAIRAMLGKAVPMGRIGTADEVAELACFLLSDRSSHVTAQAVAADGGMLGTHTPK